MEVLTKSSLTSADILIDFLTPNPNNINEMSHETLQRLVEEIKDVGFLVPLNVIPMENGQYMIIGGEHRWRAAKIAGYTSLPVVIHTDAKWTDEDFRDAVTFKLNVIKGSQNPEKFVKLYERLALKFGPESLQEVFAVTDKSLWKKLTKSIKKDLKASGLPDTLLDQVDEAESKSKDMNQFSKHLNKIFKDHAQTGSSILFVNGNTEHILIQASTRTFQAVKELVNLAAHEGKDVNELLESVLSGVL